MPMLYTEEFLKIPGNLDRLVKNYVDGMNALPPVNKDGVNSQIKAVNTHSVGKKRLTQLKESDIPILICTGDTDIMVRPKASLYLKSVSIIISNHIFIKFEY